MGRITELAGQIRWYWTSLMGDNAYARYVEHRSRTHPGEAVMTERDYWRARHRASAVEPRCC